MTKEFNDDFIKDIDDTLDKYEKQEVGLNNVSFMPMPACLEMSVETLSRMSPQLLMEATFEVQRYSLYVQRLINKEKAWERWAISQSDKLTAHFLKDIPQGYGFSQQELMARNNHPLCRKVNEFLQERRMRIDRLYDIPNNVRKMADTIREIKFLSIKRERDA